MLIQTKYLVFLVFGAFLFAACESYEVSYKKRAKKAEESTGDIVIGVVDSERESSLFFEGITLAIEEINQEGGILGRNLRFLYHDDEGDLRKGQKIARVLARNHDIVAVVGHLYSSVAIPVSITYEKSGIVFITPWATQPSLTKYAGEFTFRNIPNDEETGKQVAD